MKHIKPYKIFENASPNFPTTRDEVIEVCKKYDIENYTINDDLSIDVAGGVNLAYKNLEHLPLKFNYVSGNFLCRINKLKSLEGCPRTVNGSFFCNDNELKTLEGSPQTIDGDFHCFNNELKTLEGSPQTIGGNFLCFVNKLKSFEGSPQTVGGSFYCADNELRDLEYFPEVDGSTNMRENPVNLLLYTFIYLPEANNFLIEYFNDYEIVRNRDTVMLDRLQTFIRDNNLKMPDLDEIKKHYKIIE